MGNKTDNLFGLEAKEYAAHITEELAESEDYRRGVIEGYLQGASKYYNNKLGEAND